MDKEEISKEFIKMLISNMKEDPFENLSSKEIAKDLGIGKNGVIALFKRPDFPSINVGRKKVVTRLAYYLWKLERRI